MDRSCPLCCQSESKPFFEEGPESYFRCPVCELIFLDPAQRPGLADERERYLLHENDVEDLGYRAFVGPLFDHVSGRLPKGAAGLDFGAGTGPVLACMLRDAGYEVSLYDPFFYPDTECLNRTYDFIVACEVAEHLFEPHFEFARLKGMLKGGGLLALSTSLFMPGRDFASWHYRRDPTHVVFYSEASFRWIGSHMGFREVLFPGPATILMIS